MVLFEHEWALGISGTALVVGLLIRWFLSGSPRHAGTAAVAALIVAGLVAINVWIVTPREQIRQLCRTLAKIVDDGDVAALEQLLAPDFEAADLDREGFIEAITKTLTRHRLDYVRVRNLVIELHDRESAAVTFNAFCNVRSAQGFAAALPTRWQLMLSRERDRWLVHSIRSIPVPPFNIRDLSRWLR